MPACITQPTEPPSPRYSKFQSYPVSPSKLLPVNTGSNVEYLVDRHTYISTNQAQNMINGTNYPGGSNATKDGSSGDNAFVLPLCLGLAIPFGLAILGGLGYWVYKCLEDDDVIYGGPFCCCICCIPCRDCCSDCNCNCNCD
jgi:hypothetical protein